MPPTYTESSDSWYSGLDTGVPSVTAASVPLFDLLLPRTSITKQWIHPDTNRSLNTISIFLTCLWRVVLTEISPHTYLYTERLNCLIHYITSSLFLLQFVIMYKRIPWSRASQFVENVSTDHFQSAVIEVQQILLLHDYVIKSVISVFLCLQQTLCSHLSVLKGDHSSRNNEMSRADPRGQGSCVCPFSRDVKEWCFLEIIFVCVNLASFLLFPLFNWEW